MVRVLRVLAARRDNGLRWCRRPVFGQRTVTVETKNFAGEARTGAVNVMALAMQRAEDFARAFARQLHPGFVLTHGDSP